jgi:hypothetical protein
MSILCYSDIQNNEVVVKSPTEFDIVKFWCVFVEKNKIEINKTIEHEMSKSPFAKYINLDNK